MTQTASDTSNSPVPGGDPRDALAGAIDLAATVLGAVRPEQYGHDTPCPEYDVRMLCNHLVSVLRRVAVLGAGGDFGSVPHFATDVADGEWATAWTDANRDVATVWSDPAVLAREIRLPWGALPGAAAAVMYTNEITLHTWDIAQATGQRPAWDPAVLALPLAAMKRAVPEQPRGNPVPFGPVVPVPDSAPDIDRLVGWYGRQP